MSYSRVFVSYSHFGLVTAAWHRFECGEEIVLLKVGTNATFHLPYEQALALRADLDEALVRFTPAVSVVAPQVVSVEETETELDPVSGWVAASNALAGLSSNAFAVRESKGISR